MLTVSSSVSKHTLWMIECSIYRLLSHHALRLWMMVMVVVAVVMLGRLSWQARLLPALVPYAALFRDMFACLSAAFCRLNRSSRGSVPIVMRRASAVFFEVCAVAIRSSRSM